MPKLSSFVLATVVFAALASGAHADTITLGSVYREATLGPWAEDDHGDTFGDGNTTASDLTNYFGGTGWTRVGDANTDNGLSDGDLTIALTDGTWGGTSVEGTWAIDSSFWSAYGEGVISIHVGGGQYDPDHFAWFITAGETSGTFSYDRLSGNGGGFSNVQLWGRGASAVPEPGTLVLLGAGLFGLTRVRRRQGA